MYTYIVSSDMKVREHVDQPYQLFITRAASVPASSWPCLGTRGLPRETLTAMGDTKELTNG